MFHVQSEQLKFGLEWELQIPPDVKIGKVLDLCKRWSLEEPTKEFINCMFEMAMEPCFNPEGQVDKAWLMIQNLQGQEIEFNKFAYDSERIITEDDVTSNTGYYQWVKEFVGRMNKLHQMSAVSLQGNFSAEGLIGEEKYEMVSLLRRLSFLLAAPMLNSPYGGYYSYRLATFPIRWDTPHWKNAQEHRAWIEQERKENRLYPGEDATPAQLKPWATVLPRGDFENGHIEIRVADGGMHTPELVKAWIQLCKRVIILAPYVKTLLGGFVSTQEKHNLIAVARDGRNASISLGSKTYNFIDLARDFYQGIPELEKYLEEGSPAEIAVRNQEAPQFYRNSTGV